MRLLYFILVGLLTFTSLQALVLKSKLHHERDLRRKLEKKVHDYEEVYIYESGTIEDEPETEASEEEPDPNPLCQPALPTNQPKPAWTSPDFYRVNGYLNAPLWDKKPTK